MPSPLRRGVTQVLVEAGAREELSVLSNARIDQANRRGIAGDERLSGAVAAQLWHRMAAPRDSTTGITFENMLDQAKRVGFTETDMRTWIREAMLERVDALNTAYEAGGHDAVRVLLEKDNEP